MSYWARHKAKWQNCQGCELAKQRRKIVLARGQLNPCDMLFVGEAPGTSEDLLGKPMVGPAGKLFDSILAEAVPSGVRYAITNLVACYPKEAKEAGVNEPPKQCIQACAPRLVEFVHIAEPLVIVCVGTLAGKWCPKLLGDVYDGLYIKVVHPAAILRKDQVDRSLAINMCRLTIADAAQTLL